MKLEVSINQRQTREVLYFSYLVGLEKATQRAQKQQSNSGQPSALTFSENRLAGQTKVL